MHNIPTLNEIKQTAELVNKYAHRTPVMTSKTINKMAGCELFFKCENFQKIGAFKIRGAISAVFSLSHEEISRGVVTHSSGNHAAAVAFAADLRGGKAYIVMPRTAPRIKKDAVGDYGGEIIYCEPTLEAREKVCGEVIDKTGAVFLHPFNDYRIIRGQATAALEILDQVEDLDYIIPPVGGGGLSSGTALTTHYVSPKTKVICAEPEGANDAFRSLKDGKIYPSVNPKTIADGLLTSLGDKTFDLIQKYVSEIITVKEESIIQAMRTVWERMKIVIEPSSAVTLAAVMENKEKFAGKRVCLIFTGGNVDLDKLPWL